LLGPGRLDVEEFEDALLGVGEAVECDAVVGVGEAESLEGGEDVAAGGCGGAAFGQQARELFVVAERVACLTLDESATNRRSAAAICASVLGCPQAESQTTRPPGPVSARNRSSAAPMSVSSAALPGSGRA
jgi:hypothetical protein